MIYELYGFDHGSCNTAEFLVFNGSESRATRPFRLYVWIARSKDRTVVIDPGAPDPEVFNRMTYDYCPGGWVQTPEQTTPAILERAGIRPEDVSDVILTHLHYDHSANAAMFPNARIVVSQTSVLARIPRDMTWRQAVEMMDTFECPGVRECCPANFGRYLRALRGEEAGPLVSGCGCRINCRLFLEHVKDAFPSRIHFSTNEEEVVPGIRVFRVGGHSPCSQAVVIRTAKGKAMLCGDTIYLYENLEKGIPVGHSVVPESLEAMRRAREEADIILPGHDPKVLEEHPDGRIA